jgi:uncharacterized protein YndB with AHSA1/START domain
VRATPGLGVAISAADNSQRIVNRDDRVSQKVLSDGNAPLVSARAPEFNRTDDSDHLVLQSKIRSGKLSLTNSEDGLLMCRFKIAAGALVVLLFGGAESEAGEARRVIHEVTVNAPPSIVWRHWTTLEGLQLLFVPGVPPLQGRVELRANGPYELYFLTDNPEGLRGGEESRILAFEPERMLSFTWKNTPYWKIRPFLTHVLLTFEPMSANRTRVRLVQSGFGETGEWRDAYAYFDQAWARVLSRMVTKYGGAQTGVNAPGNIM